MDNQEDHLIERTPRHSLGASRLFLIGVAALAILLGYTLGLMSFNSTGSRFEGSSALYDEELVTSLVDKASPAVVEVNVVQRTGSLRLPSTGSGSGFLVDDAGHIITNHHVVDGADEITVKLSDGRTLQAKKLGTSPADDLALLLVDAEDVSGIDPLPLADSNDIRTGQMAIAIGSPFHNFNSVTVGVVSGTGRGPSSVLRRPIPDMIQTDAPLNPGNSGGPLLNSDGQVIGVTSSVRTGTFQEAGDFRIGFAVPSNTVASLLPDLLEPRQVRRPWLGISGGSVGGGLAMDLPPGIYVTSVFSGSPAARVGLVPGPFRGEARGDVITAVDGQTVDSVEDMVSYFNSRRPGDDVTLSVFRDGQTVELQVTLAEWPDT